MAQDIPFLTAMIRAGASGADVARYVGITRERVRQIWLSETGAGLPRLRAHRDAEGVRQRRFWASIEINAVTGCWEWTGGRSPQGYGQTPFGGRERYAHRWAYIALRGAIPAGLQIDHLCRNRGCVNPDHLEPVTASENIRRSPTHISAVMRRRTHCRYGHEFTPDNTAVSSRGTRRCRECSRTASRAARQRRRAA